MAEEIIFIAPLPALRKRTRLAKMVPVMLARGHTIRFYGWERIKGEAEAFVWGLDAVEEDVLMRGGGYASRWARALYPIWMLKVFLRVLFLGRNRLLFCLGWETAFPALLAARLTGSRVVFDDADRFSMILRLPGAAGAVLRWLEQWASRRASVHIIPGFSRYEWRHDRMVLLRNSPLSADFEAAKLFTPQRPQAAVVLYANGWIGQTRGAPIFLKLLEIARLRGIDLHIVIAGRVDGVAAPFLVADPDVTFLGELSQRDALSWYTVVDGVLTYYDPAIAINRKAESNKWGDAVFFGCPIIVNSEVETAQSLIEAGAALSTPYSDADGLADIALSLANHSDIYKSTAQTVASLLPEYPVFDIQLAEILDLLAIQPEVQNVTS